jgi:phosphate transport system substrate-binding protein
LPSILNPRLRWLGLLLAIAAIAALAAACGDDDDDDNGDDPTATSADGGGIDYGSLSGNIDIDGSSTVYPISIIAAEDFNSASNANVAVALSGTGGGFEKFCRGETQISDASRPIKDDEIAACAANGLEEIIEFQVAIDALTIVTNPDNDFATCLTTEQVVDIFRDGGASNWSDIDPSFPDEPIVKYYPGADSGTFDYFVEVMEGVDESYVHTADGTSSEDDNVLVIGVEGDQYAIGYFGLAYYVEAGQNLNAVEVDGGEGCVAPSAEAAQSGEYFPYSRPLFIYTDASILEEREEVVGFINFYFENLDPIVEETGYATMAEDQKATQWAKLDPFLP